MKYLKTLLITTALLLPATSFGAFAVGWNATSTTQGWILPTLLNGIFQTIVGPNFIATSTTATSTFAGGIQTNLLNVVSITASSTFANGINLTKGCFAINNVCTGLGSGSGSVTSVATNNGLTGGTITTTGTLGLDLSKLGTTNQSNILTWNGSQLVSTGTPNLTVGYITATTTTATSTFASGVQATYLNLTGAATATSTSANGLNLTGGCFAINGTCVTGLGGSGGSGTVTSVTLATPNSSLSLGGTNPVTTSGTINADINLNHANFYTALQNFTFATTSTFGATSTVYLTGVGSAGGLAVDGNGKVYSGATSTLANISGSLAPSQLSGGSTNTVLLQNGIDVKGWAAVNLGTMVTGTLPVANGGTGATTFTGANLLYGNGTGSVGSIATTTASCSGLGMLSCSSFTIVGSSPVTLQSAPYLFPNNATSTQLTFSGGFVGTNGSTTNFVATSTLGVATSTPGTPLSVTGAGTFTGQVEALNFYATSTTATSTFLGQISGNRVTAATARFTGLVSCDTIDSDLYGNLVCGTDATGAGGAVTGNGIAGMMTAWSSGSNIVGTSTIIGERFVATSTTAASSTIPNLGLTNLSVSGNAEIGVPRYPWLSGMLLSVDSTGLTEATGTPTAGFFNATSTTASSTFQGLESNLLHVRSTTASSTFENGINLTKGCFAINSVCITGGAASSASTTLLSTDSNTFFGATTTHVLGSQFNGYTNFAGTTTFITNTLHTVENKVATSTTMNIDWAKGNFQTVNIFTAGITINFTNPTYGDGLSLLVCNQSSGTAGTITWGSVISWPGGLVPGQTTTANQCDLWSWRYSVGTSTATVGSAKYFLTGLTSGYQ